MAEFYVAPDGSDQSGSGTINDPWKTIAKGVSSLNSGDTLYLRGGLYVEKNLITVRKNNTTITAYKAEEPVWDVKKEFPPNINGNVPYNALIVSAASGVVISGLEFRNSRGRAITLNGSDCIVRNCSINWTGRHGIHVEGNNCLLENTKVTDSSQLASSGGQIQFRYVNGGTAKGCTVSGGGGQGIIYIQCQNVKALNNTIFDAKAAHLYFDNVDTGLMDSNAVFRTDESKYPPGNQIIISQELYPGETVKTKDITVTNNLAIGGGVPFNFPVGRDRDSLGDGEVRPIPDAGFKNCKVANNIFINGETATVRIQDHEETDISEHTPCWFANNIVIQDDPEKRIFAFRNATTVAKWDFSNNSYNRKPDNVIQGTGDLYGPISLVNYKKTLRTPADFDPKNYQLIETSREIDAGTSDLPITIDKDYFGKSRDSKLDIGFHEYIKDQFITAAFSAKPRDGVAPLSVQFTDRSTSSDPITAYFWDFGDGAISTVKNPLHKYNSTGKFTVSLRVAGEGGSDIATKSNLISITPPVDNIPGRVTAGLTAFYRFDEGSGDTVFDVSGVSSPLDLKIGDNSAVRWLDQGIQVTAPTIIGSTGPATGIIAASRESNAITVELWLETLSLRQDGPARIVSISNNVHSRNLTVGQGLWGTQPTDLYDLRLRTTERSANGMPSFSTPSGAVTKNKTHLVITHHKDGRTRIFLDKFVVAETIIPGDFSTWNPRFPLVLANEASGDNPWLGTIYLLAVYERALSLDEVKQNFDAGTSLASTPEAQTITTAEFRRFLLVPSGNGRTLVSGTAVGFGVQYPDMRCVLCANGQANSMAVYPDIHAVIRTYSKQGLQVDWLD